MLRLTGLGRELDFTLPEHRWLAVLVLSAATGAAILTRTGGAAWLQAGLEALAAGAAVFFTWALARELDPDSPRSALLAAAVAGPATLVFEPASILLSGWALIALRLVARTTGVPARPLDTVGLLGISLWLALARGPWIMALGALALGLDGWLEPEKRSHKLGALVAALLALGLALASGWTPAAQRPARPLFMVGLLGLAALFFVLPAGRGAVQSSADYTGEPLRTRRVRAGQLLAVGAVTAAALADGSAGLQSAGALLSALTGIVIFHLARTAAGTLLR